MSKLDTTMKETNTAKLLMQLRSLSMSSALNLLKETLDRITKNAFEAGYKADKETIHEDV